MDIWVIGAGSTNRQGVEVAFLLAWRSISTRLSFQSMGMTGVSGIACQASTRSIKKDRE
jgi:hypothetical protein